VDEEVGGEAEIDVNNIPRSPAQSLQVGLAGLSVYSGGVARWILGLCYWLELVVRAHAESSARRLSRGYGRNAHTDQVASPPMLRNSCESLSLVQNLLNFAQTGAARILGLWGSFVPFLLYGTRVAMERMARQRLGIA